MTPRLRPFARLFGLVPALLLALLLGGSVTRAEDPADLLNNLKLPGDDLPGLPGFELGGLKKAVVSAQILGIQDGQPLLQIKLEIPEHFHVYSTTQPSGPAGGPTKTTITLDAGSPPIAKEFLADRRPIETMSESFPGTPIEQYEGIVVWTAPLNYDGPLDTLRVLGSLNGLICKDGLQGECIPVDEKFVAAYSPTAVSFVSKGTYLDAKNELTIRGELSPAVIAPGGKAKLTLTIEPKAGWHTYPWSATKLGGGSKPTLIVFTNNSGLTVGAPITAAPIVEGAAGDEKIRYHEGAVTWTIEISAPPDAKPGERSLSGLFGYQVCTNAMCLQPSAVGFEGTLSIGTPSDQSVPLGFRAAKYNDAEKALVAESEPKTAAAEPEEASFLWAMVAAFLGGLILNLMPCVLPVIGLKILSFAEQAGQSRLQVLALNLWYSLGVLVVFWGLAALGVFFGLSWGQHFASTWFNVLMASVVFTMGLSFLGVWEIPVPGFATSDQASELADREGAMGAFFKGVLTTVLATPCTGPLLGTALSYVLHQPPLVTFLIFTAVGLGMASPYIVIGLEPSLIRFLPKPGEWMNTFKQVLGFVMMGAVVFLYSTINPQYQIATLTLLVGLALGCWMIGRIPAGSEWPESVQGWSWATGSAVLVGILAFSFLGPNEHELKWQPWSPTRPAELAREGKTVLVDFTASWCATCKVNLKFAINTAAVKSAVEDKGVVTLLADWSDGSKEIQQELKKLGFQGIPLLAIYPAGRPDQVIVLPNVVTQADIVAALEKAGPSRAQAGNQAVVTR